MFVVAQGRQQEDISGTDVGATQIPSQGDLVCFWKMWIRLPRDMDQQHKIWLLLHLEEGRQRLCISVASFPLT
ncbi:unnamed protein product [Lactuca virosa]|uniref:Uncharacterized protein n=1 Tax=Lactuca virosa TaxID=75947 RepID=A0AAU9N410_9ASTR|nr:unnamed protein product [Lactuca virosa]